MVVDLNSGLGDSDVETEGVAVCAAALRSLAAARISSERKHGPGPKDAIYGGALSISYRPLGEMWNRGNAIRVCRQRGQPLSG